MGTLTRIGAQRVLSLDTGHHRVLDGRGIPIGNLIFSSRESALICMDGTLSCEWTGDELVGGVL